MSPLQITLIIVGIIFFIISCFLIDKSKTTVTKTTTEDSFIDRGLTEEQKKQLQDKMDELLSDVSEEVIVRTDDTLSKISNEKIIAVHEFSDQILEKINRNHEEVIFLYNMLNDKEKELKSSIKELEPSKKKIQEVTDAPGNKSERSDVMESPVTKKMNVTTQVDNMEKISNSTNEFSDKNMDNTPKRNPEVNSNAQILSLYSKGKSIVDISKELDLGQGEVKLVIDLFKAKK